MSFRNDDTLHVVAVISNPERYKSRYRLAEAFFERMKATPNVALHVVEAQHGDRAHALPSDLQLVVHTNAWIKENMINLAVKRLLPRDWRYLAWVDADVEFRSPGWALETIHKLQQFPVVQPWQHCADLGPNGEILQTHTSFGFLDQQGVRKQRHSGEPYQYAHSGYAWACTRAFWEQVEGLPDFCILGSADHHAAWAMVGDVEPTIHGKMLPSYRRRLREWQARATRATKGEVGFTVGRIEHHWHGSKAKRFYRERWQILVDHAYDPDTDLARDDQGVLYIAGKPRLEADIRRYNVSRNEDSIDV